LRWLGSGLFRLVDDGLEVHPLAGQFHRKSEHQGRKKFVVQIFAMFTEKSGERRQ
jgi:hypothetical protein